MQLSHCRTTELYSTSTVKPSYVAEIHREICEREKCQYLDKVNYADSCAFCPSGHWGQYEIGGCDDPNRKIEGLGDVVALVAGPITKGIDAILGTRLQNCGGCGKRQTKLNQLIPFK